MITVDVIHSVICGDTNPFLTLFHVFTKLRKMFPLDSDGPACLRYVDICQSVGVPQRHVRSSPESLLNDVIHCVCMYTWHEE